MNNELRETSVGRSGGPVALLFEQQGRERSLRTATTALPFEQQPKESAKAFAAFKTYLELGPQRSLVRVGEKLGKSRQMIERWSRKFDWPARVQAHGAHLADLERKAAEAVAVRNGVDWAGRQEQHREDEWQARSELLGLAREAIARWKKAEHRCGTLEGIARLLDLASKLGRVSSGLSLEPQENTGEGEAAFMIQIEVALEKIYGAEVPPPTVTAPARTVRPAKVIDVKTVGELPTVSAEPPALPSQP
jgi:hypothetical protein